MQTKTKRNIVFAIVVGLFFAFMNSFAIGTNAAAASSQPVYVIPVHAEIERGLGSFLERGFQEAEKVSAKAIVLDIDTYGGAVDAADEIGQRIRDSSIPVIAFIQGNAASAGAYIALNADQIIMTPGSSIGASAVRDTAGKEVDPKITSYWASKMRAAAELNGRNKQIAEAMVDPKVTVPGLKENTTAPLTLSAQEAIKQGYAEHLSANLDEALKWLKLDQQPLVRITPTPAEKVARWVTSPYIIPILLILGFGGIAVELLIPGFGIPGIIGLLSLGLYFFGHYIAGFAGIEVIILFIAGVLLMIIEIFVPGFGLFGTLGIGSLILSIVLAAYNTVQGLLSLSIAVVTTVIISVLAIKYFGHRGVWNRFILRDEMKREEGYTAQSNKSTLLGKKGVSLTPLRPAGTVLIDDKRVDAVTSGEFIAAGQPVEVRQVEGARVVVRQGI